MYFKKFQVAGFHPFHEIRTFRQLSQRGQSTSPYAEPETEEINFNDSLNDSITIIKKEEKKDSLSELLTRKIEANLVQTLPSLEGTSQLMQLSAIISKSLLKTCTIDEFHDEVALKQKISLQAKKLKAALELKKDLSSLTRITSGKLNEPLWVEVKSDNLNASITSTCSHRSVRKESSARSVLQVSDFQ